jgi:alpha-L-fucosidase
MPPLSPTSCLRTSLKITLLWIALALPCFSGAQAQEIDPVTERAAHIVPSLRQLNWQRLEFTAFIHFGINTFTDREWGDGTEDPGQFNPTAFDARQWAEVAYEAGMRMIILTAKHHDGFCLWPSRYTQHSVRSSPWRNGSGDVVAEVAAACEEFGLKFGVYLSPWDRNAPSYGDSEAYNDYFRNQLSELLSNYGPIAEVWFDGAVGEGPDGQRQVYDWVSYFEVVRDLQPDAVIFGMGPDVRWVGNEAGHARESEWSVLNITKSWADYNYEECSKPDLGSRAMLGMGQNLVWYPAETDVSLRPGWFYHPAEDDQVKTLADLLHIYYDSVGRNTVLLLNVPPDRRGLIHENDASRLRELGATLDATFSSNLAHNVAVTASHTVADDPSVSPEMAVDGDWATYWTPGEGRTAALLELDLGEPRTFDVIELQEQIELGQRVEEFVVDVWDGGYWREIGMGSTIGYKRLLRFETVTSHRIRLRIRSSRLEPRIGHIGVYRQPESAPPPPRMR